MRRRAALTPRPLAYRFIDDPAVDTVSVVLAGDLMGLTGDRVPRCSPGVAEVFARADLIVCNCESPVTREHKRDDARYFATFGMGAAYLRDFFAHFRVAPERCVFSIANTHSGDQGVAGLVDTERRLRALGVTPVGMVRGDGAPLVHRDVGGVRVGVAAWTHWLNCDVFASPSSPGYEAAPRAAQENDARRVPWRRNKADAGIDCLLAFPRWESELQHYPGPDTVDRALALSAVGFDAIAGHHPHVVQPLEWLPGLGADDELPVLCHFSLGNLFARTVSWPHRLLQVLELEIAAAGLYRGRVIGYRCHSMVQLDTSTGGRVVRLTEAPWWLRERMQRRLDHLFLAEMKRGALAS